ncbi:hypothetical protein LHJ74_13655 [Streptomyces sp. N2-109]|uniref:Integral membrane protein n=1 Tax=Streptomyces gossypii TaxID=2883101 RepID=A0ABT2JST0_9ACTN|nr:hypothetical protein [Streptomyces gossypii]MCT2590942.1 hypothetical protein [Streptomyces gossypii]
MVDNDGDVADRGNAWFQRLVAHIADLQGQINGLGKQESISDEELESINEAKNQLTTARESLQHSDLWSRFSGKATDRALANVHEAEVVILRITRLGQMRWKALAVLVQARLHLHPTDLRLKQLEKLLQPDGDPAELRQADRELLVDTLHAANQAEEAERARVRSFAHILMASTAVMGLIAFGFAIFAVTEPAVGERFCFPQDQDNPNAPLTVCPLGNEPTWQGVWFIEFVGMLAAAVTGAVSLRKVRGNSSPYHVLINLLLLRLPVGALTAVVGVVLLSGKFFPGLTALDTSSQIIAWAMAFGVLQEAVTRTIDRQGQHLLESVKAPGREQPEGEAKPPRDSVKGNSKREK